MCTKLTLASVFPPREDCQPVRRARTERHHFATADGHPCGTAPLHVVTTSEAHRLALGNTQRVVSLSRTGSQVPRAVLSTAARHDVLKTDIFVLLGDGSVTMTTVRLCDDPTSSQTVELLNSASVQSLAAHVSGILNDKAETQTTVKTVNGDVRVKRRFVPRKGSLSYRESPGTIDVILSGSFELDEVSADSWFGAQPSGILALRCFTGAHNSVREPLLVGALLSECESLADTACTQMIQRTGNHLGDFGATGDHLLAVFSSHALMTHFPDASGGLGVPAMMVHTEGPKVTLHPFVSQQDGKVMLLEDCSFTHARLSRTAMCAVISLVADAGDEFVRCAVGGAGSVEIIMFSLSDHQCPTHQEVQLPPAEASPIRSLCLLHTNSDVGVGLTERGLLFSFCCNTCAVTAVIPAHTQRVGRVVAFEASHPAVLASTLSGELRTFTIQHHAGVANEGTDETVVNFAEIETDSVGTEIAPPRGSGRVASATTEGRSIGSNFFTSTSLGSGCFGEVFRAVYQPTGELFAVKRVAVPGIEERESGAESTAARDRQQLEVSRALFHEVRTLTQLPRHRTIVRSFGAFAADGHLNMVMELAGKGSLDSHLRKLQSDSSTALPEALLKGWLAQLASGLAHIHRHRVLHRDIKPHNILVRCDGTLCWTDFGVAALASSETLSAGATADRTVIGTEAFAPPEVLSRIGSTSAACSARSDVWALGAVMYCIVLGIDGMVTSPLELTECARGSYPTLIDLKRGTNLPQRSQLPLFHTKGIAFAPQQRDRVAHLSDEFVGLIDWMMSHKHRDRPFASDVVAHPALQPQLPKELAIRSPKVQHRAVYELQDVAVGRHVDQFFFASSDSDDSSPLVCQACIRPPPAANSNSNAMEAFEFFRDHWLHTLVTMPPSSGIRLPLCANVEEEDNSARFEWLLPPRLTHVRVTEVALVVIDAADGASPTAKRIEAFAREVLMALMSVISAFHQASKSAVVGDDQSCSAHHHLVHGGVRPDNVFVSIELLRLWASGGAFRPSVDAVILGCPVLPWEWSAVRVPDMPPPHASWGTISEQPHPVATDGNKPSTAADGSLGYLLQDSDVDFRDAAGVVQHLRQQLLS